MLIKRQPNYFLCSFVTSCGAAKFPCAITEHTGVVLTIGCEIDVLASVELHKL